MNVVFRGRITRADREKVDAITASSGFFSDAEVATALEVCDDAIDNANTAYHFLLAEDAGEVVGYACWGKDSLTDFSYELYWIAVQSRERSHGIGGRLLEAVEEQISRADPLARLYIDTAGREQYVPTRTFYEHHGYSVVATLEDYYSAGDAKVIYAKRLARACEPASP